MPALCRLRREHGIRRRSRTGAFDQIGESLALAWVAAHEVGVDVARELGAGVAELGPYEGEVLAAGDEDRGNGVAENQ